MKLFPLAGIVSMLVCICSCQQHFEEQKVAQLGSREVWLGNNKTQTKFSSSRSFWQLPLRLSNPGGEQISLEVQLECDSAHPSSGVISLINLRRQDPLLGLDRRDSSLERSWSGLEGPLPPLWLRQLSHGHCGVAKMPPRWRSI